MKQALYFILLISTVLLAGCATTDDLKALRSELNRNLEEKFAAADANFAALRKDIAKNSEALAQTRKGGANTAADVAELRDNLQQLRGQLEALRRDIARSAKKEEEHKERLDGILLKINFIENFLEISKKEAAGEAGKASGGIATKDQPKKLDKESMYSSAYQTFKDGHYDKARNEFQNFLNLYPDSEYSDNAQFWIGECFFFEKNYEKAILEYEKVTKNYPGGNKVPFALLKQGISFLHLNDKTSARLLLQQVIKDYPNTNQARIARSKLQEIK